LNCFHCDFFLDQKQIREESESSISSHYRELSGALHHVSVNINHISDELSNTANHEIELNHQKQIIEELRSKYQQVIQKSITQS
jgi:cell shape-determining protein MreC